MSHIICSTQPIAYSLNGTHKSHHASSKTNTSRNLVSLLAADDVVSFLDFTQTAPWKLPAQYVDSKNGCEMRLDARAGDSADHFPLSHVLQTAARIASHCQQYMKTNLGGQALVGTKQMFVLDVYGPGGGVVWNRFLCYENIGHVLSARNT